MAILQSVKQHAIGGGIPRLEKGVKELEQELKEGMGGSKVKLNKYMKRLRRNFCEMFICLIGFGGVVCYTEIISPSSFY